MSKLTQEQRILQVLQRNRGSWTSGQYFLHEMFISQFHRAIHNLEHRDGIKVEHSDFKDERGFVSYRLLENPVQGTMIL